MATAPPDAGATIRRGSKSFALASRLFDRRTRELVWDLYAWCRHCDDVTDDQQFGHQPAGRDSHPAATRATVVVADAANEAARGARVAELRTLTARALQGDSGSRGPFAGLARVAAETGLPARYVYDHLAGFEMDAAGLHCEQLEDTLTYCYHVAGVVGLMMAWIMGVRDDDTLRRGCDLGMGFQLTNIARDVNDDACNGRVYLPAAWLRDGGVRIVPGAPLDDAARRAVVPVVARLLDEADRYYASSWFGMARLPWRCAWAVGTARHVYADIGGGVRQRGAAAWDERVSTSTGRKIGRLVQALLETGWAVGVDRHRCAPARQGLWEPAGEAHARLGA